MQKLLKSKAFHAVGILAVVLSVIMFNLGSLTKSAIEKIASNTIQTKVTISSLDISIVDKSVTVKGIIVSNPKGFKTPHLLKLDTISVTAEDLTSDVIVLKEILVDGLDVQYELGIKGSNLGQIKKNLKSSAGTVDQEKTEKSLIINKLRMINAKVTPTINIGDKGVKAPISLPDITVVGIGSKSKPATPAKAISKPINALLSATSTAVTKAGLGDALLKSLTTDTLKNKTKEANKALKGLFGK